MANLEAKARVLCVVTPTVVTSEAQIFCESLDGTFSGPTIVVLGPNERVGVAWGCRRTLDGTFDPFDLRPFAPFCEKRGFGIIEVPEVSYFCPS